MSDPCTIYLKLEVLEGSLQQLRRDATEIPLAKNLSKAGKGSFDSSNVGWSLCLSNLGKCHKTTDLGKWECLNKEWMEQEKRGNVCSLYLMWNLERAANCLSLLLICNWKLQLLCLVWQMQLVSNSKQCLEGVRHFR